MVNYAFNRLPASGEEISVGDLELISGGIQTSEVTYDGDATATKLIEVGFTAKFALIMDTLAPHNAVEFAYFDGLRVASIGLRESYVFATAVATGTTIDVGTTTGIGYYFNANQLGRSYKLIAFTY